MRYVSTFSCFVGHAALRTETVLVSLWRIMTGVWVWPGSFKHLNLQTLSLHSNFSSSDHPWKDLNGEQVACLSLTAGNICEMWSGSCFLLQCVASVPFVQLKMLPFFFKPAHWNKHYNQDRSTATKSHNDISVIWIYDLKCRFKSGASRKISKPCSRRCGKRRARRPWKLRFTCSVPQTSKACQRRHMVLDKPGLNLHVQCR